MHGISNSTMSKAAGRASPNRRDNASMGDLQSWVSDPEL